MAALTLRKPERAGTAIVVGANVALAGLLLAGLGPAAVLLALLVPAGLALVQRPQRGLLALAALAPFNGLLIIAPVPAAAKGWKEALVVVTLAATFLAPAEARAPAKRPLPMWAPAVAGLIIVGILSGLAVGGLQAVVGVKIAFFYVLLAWAVWRCPLDAKERDRLVTILMVAGVLTSAYGLLQQLLGAPRLAAMGYPYDETIRFAGGFLRSFSSFNQPFPFGFFVMLVVLIGIPQALSEPGRLRNRLFLLCLPLFGLAILSTIVRAAWLGLAVGVAWLGSHRYRILLLAIPVGVVALAFLPHDVSTAALSSSSTSERTAGWRANVTRAQANPLGVGVGASGSASAKVATLQRSSANTYQPDNYYFKTLLELGVVGLWFLILLLFGAFSATRRAAFRLEGRDAALASGVAASVLAAVVACFVATYFEIFPMDLLFWLLLAVVATCEV
ncbi:MAG: hypothetical protein QOG03_2039 [Actinomycetota bacterium]|jgi:hypothetical protein|nr:hypothetical protein [Actinomycetota bacterium]